jgi:hypothetical protein
MRTVERVGGDVNFGSRAYGRGPANGEWMLRDIFSPLRVFLTENQNQTQKNSAKEIPAQPVRRLFLKWLLAGND